MATRVICQPGMPQVLTTWRAVAGNVTTGRSRYRDPHISWRSGIGFVPAKAAGRRPPMPAGPR